jgi:hypothetical protein
MSPSKVGRNDPCWCGSGKKFKSCHLEPTPTAPPAITEEALIAAFKEGSECDLRDPREIGTFLAKSGKPMLLVDEKRFGKPGAPFVFFSVVLLPASVALAALPSIWRVCRDNSRAASLTGPRLLRESMPDAVALRAELEKHLAEAVVIRAGITYNSLRAWRSKTNWRGVKTVQSGIEIKKTEFAVLQNLGVGIVRDLELNGLVLMVVDQSVQNGLDSKSTKLSVGELGAVTFDIPGCPAHLMILASTPEGSMVGPWIRLPDLDAAKATNAPEFKAFAARVQSAPSDGTMIWWPEAPEPNR